MYSQIIIYKIPVGVIVNRDGPEFHAHCPELEGLHTCGKTEKEAIDNIKDAVESYIDSLEKHNEPISL